MPGNKGTLPCPANSQRCPRSSSTSVCKDATYVAAGVRLCLDAGVYVHGEVANERGGGGKKKVPGLTATSNAPPSPGY